MAINSKELVFSDLEGPITTIDAAFEAWNQHVQHPAFDRDYYPYDDQYTEEGRPGLRPGEIFQPGDTLTPIVSHFAARELTGTKLVDTVKNAGLIKNVKMALDQMQQTDCSVFIITAGYQPYAEFMGEKVGIAGRNVRATPYPRDEKMHLNKREIAIVNEIENLLLAVDKDDRDSRNAIINRFINTKMPSYPGLKHILETVIVMGGDRKTQAIYEIAHKEGKTLADVAFIGDGITDYRTMEAVNKARGLGLAFDGNPWVLSRATVAIAAYDAEPVAEVVTAWRIWGREGLEEHVRRMEEENKFGQRLVHWLPGRSVEDIIQNIVPIHRQYRTAIKGKVVGNLS